MATNQGKLASDRGTANRVQDVELLGVPRSSYGSVYDAGRGRRLSLRAVFLHDAHLQAGTRVAEGCGICSEGLEGALEKVTQRSSRRGKDEVAPGSGVDEKPATPPPSADRPGREENPVLWR